MKSAEVLHSVATEYSELGQIAKLKGQEKSHEDYMKKAFTIATEAVWHCQIDYEDDNPLKATYLRSLSWLAFHAEKYEEAYHWAHFALKIVPNDYELKKLMLLIEKIEKRFPDLAMNTSILGLLASFNILEKKISFQPLNKKDLIKIIIANTSHHSIIPFYIGKPVEIEIDNSDQNNLVLKNIKLAA